eukprot:s466_g12.t1
MVGHLRSTPKQGIRLRRFDPEHMCFIGMSDAGGVDGKVTREGADGLIEDPVQGSWLVMASDRVPSQEIDQVEATSHLDLGLRDPRLFPVSGRGGGALAGRQPQRGITDAKSLYDALIKCHPASRQDRRTALELASIIDAMCRGGGLENAEMVFHAFCVERKAMGMHDDGILGGRKYVPPKMSDIIRGDWQEARGDRTIRIQEADDCLELEEQPASGPAMVLSRNHSTAAVLISWTAYARGRSGARGEAVYDLALEGENRVTLRRGDGEAVQFVRLQEGQRLFSPSRSARRARPESKRRPRRCARSSSSSDCRRHKGDEEHQRLVQKVKSLQSSARELNERWQSYCEQYGKVFVLTHILFFPAMAAMIQSFWAILGLLVSPANACTIIAVGRSASASGAPMIGHSDDAGSSTNDIRLIRVPRQRWPEGSKRPVYFWQIGYPRLVSSERSPEYAADTHPLGFVPQVPETWAYWDTDYGVQNEWGLSIGETWINRPDVMRAVKWETTTPAKSSRYRNTREELTKIALERCKTSRCAVETMGYMAETYGFYSDDVGDPSNPDYSDGSESLVLADAEPGDLWIFNVMTGRSNSSAIWAAQRIPPDHVAAVANTFTIRHLNLSDPETWQDI